MRSLLKSIRLLACIIFLTILEIFACSFLDSASSLNQKGNKLYEEKKYQSALENYRKAQIKKPNQPEILYNVSAALYQNNEFQEAAKNLEQAIQKTRENELLAKSWYNFGNAKYRIGQFDEAINAYKKTLDLNPDDRDAKHNLEILLKKKGAFEKKQQEREKQKQNKSEQKNQNQSQSQQNKNQNQNQSSNQPKPEPDNKDNRKDQAQKQPESGESEDQNNKSKDSKDEQKSKEEEKQNEKNQKKDQPKDQPENQTNDKDKDQKNQQEETKKDTYLQGQMSKEDSLKILNALKDSEKDIQLLRRPKGEPIETDRPKKDW